MSLDEFCAAMDERKWPKADLTGCLTDLYMYPASWALPYRLLMEREPHQNISHKVMPTWEKHCAYMRSRPHLHWYAFTSPGGLDAGCVYLSKQREIGIGVLKAHRGQGLGKAAVLELMRLHPGKFLANIAPANEPSAKLFKSLGFNLIQHTYAKD